MDHVYPILCQVCEEKNAIYTCSRCYLPAYCGYDCQNVDWIMRMHDISCNIYNGVHHNQRVTDQRRPSLKKIEGT